jgi:hypothetical protein
LQEREAVTDPRREPEFALATLRVRSGMRAGMSLPVRRTVAAIGGVPGNDVVLDSPGVAARHAQLRLSGGVWTITDLGTLDGVDVDGEVVHGEALLAPGSAVRIGGVSLVFDPADRWQDSGPGRSLNDRSPLLLFPANERPFWPTALFVLAIFGIIVVLFFLFRTG